MESIIENKDIFYVFINGANETSNNVSNGSFSISISEANKPPQKLIESCKEERVTIYLIFISKTKQNKKA